MGRRDGLIARCTDDLRQRSRLEPDMAPLAKVTKGCGPSIHDRDASTVAASQLAEMETIKARFPFKRLDLDDGPRLTEGIHAATRTYGRSDRSKLWAVVHHMLVECLSREAAFA